MHNKEVSAKVLLSGVIVSMFLWGLSWPSAKVLTHYTTPVNFAVYRYILVVATLLPILFFLKVGLRVKKKRVFLLLFFQVYCWRSTVFFSSFGLKNGAPGAGGVLVTTNPIMSYSLGIILNRKWPSRNEATGLVIGLIGGCVLLKVWNSTGFLLESGNLYFLSASFTWAVMSKFTAKGALMAHP